MDLFPCAIGVLQKSPWRWSVGFGKGRSLGRRPRDILAMAIPQRLPIWFQFLWTFWQWNSGGDGEFSWFPFPTVTTTHLPSSSMEANLQAGTIMRTLVISLLARDPRSVTVPTRRKIGGFWASILEVPRARSSDWMYPDWCRGLEYSTLTKMMLGFRPCPKCSTRLC